MATVLSVDDMCRLCLDPFVESYSTIENPAMKDQLEKVFSFPIELKDGFSSSVCQSCSNSVFEFYKYSEKVRRNQEALETSKSNQELFYEGVKDDLDSETEIIEDDTQGTLMRTDLDKLTPHRSRKVNTTKKLKDAELDEFIDEVLLNRKKNADDEFISEHFKISCELCDIMTPTFAHLRHHFLKVHQDKKPYVICCGKKFWSKKPILEHIRLHLDSSASLKTSEVSVAEILPKDDKMIRRRREDSDDHFLSEHFKLTCDLCGDVAPTFAHLRNHFLIAHQRQDVYALCCGKKWIRRNRILEHVRYHLNSNTFRCEHCEDIFTTRATFMAHKFTKHQDQYAYKCDRCSRAYVSMSLLTAHLRRHDKNECPECKKAFMTKHALEEHMKKHESVEQECPQCRRIFKSRVLLDRHIRIMHNTDNKDQSYVCEHCGKTFTSIILFKRHIDAHEGIEAPKVQCSLCSRWLKSTSYKIHLETVHGNRERVHECDICHRKYPHTVALQNHKSKTHIEPRFKCEFCDKLFIERGRWEEHRTTHTGEILYSCEYCGTRFKCKTSVHKHKKRIHPDKLAEKLQLATASTQEPPVM
ncbi:zinc finger protein 429-like isoform X1 [Armigeres subalbatus]|uniref:zinc finger protein 429-like isoform X1 n=1 Tax=Armigeres subalbatus TaxID=124917 RepID=UPI002ED26F32